MTIERNIPTERRIAAVELLLSLGYTWSDDKQWKLLSERQAAIHGQCDLISVPRALVEQWTRIDAWNAPVGAAMQLKATAEQMLLRADEAAMQGQGGEVPDAIPPDVRDTVEYHYGYQQALLDWKKQPVRSVSDKQIKSIAYAIEVLENEADIRDNDDTGNRVMKRHIKTLRAALEHFAAIAQEKQS